MKRKKVGKSRTGHKERTRFKESDRVLPMLKLSNPVKIEIRLTKDDVELIIGPRDWQWDRKTGKLVGAGTALA